MLVKFIERVGLEGRTEDREIALAPAHVGYCIPLKSQPGVTRVWLAGDGGVSFDIVGNLDEVVAALNAPTETQQHLRLIAAAGAKVVVLAMPAILTAGARQQKSGTL